MRESLSGDSLYAQIVMQRQVDARLFLVVEGDDEVSIFDAHIDAESVALLEGGPKPVLLRLSEILEQQGVEYVLVCVDRDLDDLTGAAPYRGHVASTRGYDLITDVLRAEPTLLRKAAVANAKASVVAKIESHHASELFEAVSPLLLEIAALRLVNAEDGLGLNLRDFPFHDLMDSAGAVQPFERFVERANARSKIAIDPISLSAERDTLVSRLDSSGLNFGGHDIFGATAAMLRQFGAKHVGSKHLAASVITAVTCATLRSLPIYALIDTWASAHSRQAFAC